MYPKFMIDYFVQQLRKENKDVFKIIGYSTTLQMDRDYPNEFEIKLVKVNFDEQLKFLFYFFVESLLAKNFNYHPIKLYSYKVPPAIHCSGVEL